MKTRLISRVAFAMLLFLSVSSFAQSSPVISYQGTLEQNGSLAPDGKYEIVVTLYSNSQGTEPIWSDTYISEVHNGIFNVQLGSRKKLPDSKTLDGQLWLGAKINGETELKPLTNLSASPLALNVIDKSITIGKLSDELMLFLG